MLGSPQRLHKQATAHTQVYETDTWGGVARRWIRQLEDDVLGPPGDIRDTESTLAGAKAGDVFLRLGDRAWPVHVNVKDLLSAKMGAEFANDGLDFGEFGHKPLDQRFTHRSASVKSM
jgi:hypothetical protein